MTYYALLQVSSTASDKEIQKAYRALVKRYHPDQLQQAAASVRHQSEEKLKQLNIAYAILSNPSKRREYDLIHGRGQQSQAHTKRQASQKNQAGQSKTRYGHNKTTIQQKLAQARSEYLRQRQAIDNLEKQILARFMQLAKMAGLVGICTSIGAAFLFFTLSSLLEFTGLSSQVWSPLFIASILFIFQVGAVLVVMHQMEIFFLPGQNIKGIATISGSMLFSFFVVTSFTGLSFHIQAAIWEPFVYALLTHLLGCARLSQDWLKPLLLKRRKLEARLAEAEEVLIYFRNMLDQDMYGYR